MTGTDMPLMRYDEPLVNANGTPTKRFFDWLCGARGRLGGDEDKVDAAHTLAAAAVPQTTEVQAVAGLSGGGALSSNLGVTLYTVVTSVATLPASANEGDNAYAVDGRKPGEGSGAGTGCPVVWSNSAWNSFFSGAAVTA